LNHEDEYRTELLPRRLISKHERTEVHKIIILPVVLYGCETLSLKLIEDLRLKVFLKRALRRILKLKRDEIIFFWRKCHTVERRKLYPFSDKIIMIKTDEMGRVCRMHER
jgi:hypothetical protein